MVDEPAWTRYRPVSAGRMLVRAELASIGRPARVGGGSLNSEAGDLALTVGWGHAGQGGVTMPGKGKLTERAYAPDERQALEQGAAHLGLTAEQALGCLGESTYDVYLNSTAYWSHVPARVWEYTIGGYQVLKKWLSYHEAARLGRALTLPEMRAVMARARRIAALLLQPALDANYQAVKLAATAWPPALGGGSRQRT